MKTLLITLLVAGFLSLLTSCSDFLERRPTSEEIVGKWEVAWISPSVSAWIAHKGNGIHELPNGAGIEFKGDGTFAASSFPHSLDATDRCVVLSRPGTWKLIDSRADADLVRWSIEISAAGAPSIIRLHFHEDADGIYLDNPIEIDAPASVILRRVDSTKH